MQSASRRGELSPFFVCKPRAYSRRPPQSSCALSLSHPTPRLPASPRRAAARRATARAVRMAREGERGVRGRAKWAVEEWASTKKKKKQIRSGASEPPPAASAVARCSSCPSPSGGGGCACVCGDAGPPQRRPAIWLPHRPHTHSSPLSPPFARHGRGSGGVRVSVFCVAGGGGGMG